MCNWFNRNLKSISVLPFYLLTFVFCAPIFADNAQLLKQINLLEEDFKTLSSEFYQVSAQNMGEELKTTDDIDRLYDEVFQLVNKQQSITAIQLLHLNADTINANLEHNAIFVFTELLLEKNEWRFAKDLFNNVKEEGDKYLLARMHFIFAKYHAERLEWPQVSILLDGIASQLSPEEAAYAYLLNGSALQHLKKHRLAIKSYKKIPGSSQYYGYAQLNIAIAEIRQGWWTDAQSTIKTLIKNKNNDDELTNRLYLILGYTLLHKEFYRDARDAFRHIGLDSRYTNRALLGIGLTATNQGDFVGGLNALSILKNKKTYDLSIDESYLLVPYVYEKLQQELTVTASYTEAMNYYQRRINKLEAILKRHIDFTSTQYDDKTGSIDIENNILNYGKRFPESFIKNYRTLIEFLSANHDLHLKNKTETLDKKYNAVYQEIIDELLKQRIKYLKSYLNQSRYGLARLYDKTNEAAN